MTRHSISRLASVHKRVLYQRHQEALCLTTHHDHNHDDDHHHHRGVGPSLTTAVCCPSVCSHAHGRTCWEAEARKVVATTLAAARHNRDVVPETHDALRGEKTAHSGGHWLGVVEKPVPTLGLEQAVRPALGLLVRPCRSSRPKRLSTPQPSAVRRRRAILGGGVVEHSIGKGEKLEDQGRRRRRRTRTCSNSCMAVTGAGSRPGISSSPLMGAKNILITLPRGRQGRRLGKRRWRRQRGGRGEERAAVVQILWNFGWCSSLTVRPSVCWWMSLSYVTGADVLTILMSPCRSLTLSCSSGVARN